MVDINRYLYSVIPAFAGITVYFLISNKQKENINWQLL